MGVPHDVVFRQDRSGNIVGEFYTGAHSGFLLTLHVGGGTVQDFGSLAGAWFSNQPPLLKDVDGDGTFELVLNADDCSPNCADGTDTITTYRWNNVRYVVWTCEAIQGSSPPKHYPPTSKGC